MKTFRLACVFFLVACGGAEFTAPDDAGQGGSSTSTSTSMSTSTSTVSTGNGGGTTVTTGNGGGTTVTTTGSGGGRPDGGPGGSGGQTVDARADAPVSCDASTPSPVTFHMSAEGGVGYCLNTCGTPWVSILPMGSNTPLAVARSCITSCSQCQPIVCGGGACIPPQRMKPEGETYMWDGTLWEQSKCGPQMYSCVNQVCSVPPGKYVARMCANRATSDAGNFCMSDPMPTCVDVPFDYPATATVMGVLH